MSELNGLREEPHSSDCSTQISRTADQHLQIYCRFVFNSCRCTVVLEWYFLARGWGAEFRTETLLKIQVF